MQPPRRPRALVHVVIVVVAALLFGALSAWATVRIGCGGDMGWIFCLAVHLCALVSWTLFAVISTVLRLCRFRPTVSYATSTFVVLLWGVAFACWIMWVP
jgi:hypothetical protein